MAEVYGEKPKRFTKKWWSYFWDYYKWYVVAGVFLLMIVLGLLHHRYQMSKYDLTLYYAGPHYFPANHVEEISEELGALCDDVNKDGEKFISFANLTISTEDFDPEYKSSMLITLQFALEEEEIYVYIIHKNFAPRYVAQTAKDSRYAPTKDWLTADVKNAKFLSAHNLDYGVSLDGYKLFEEWNFDPKDHYLLIRKKPSDKDELPAYNAAIAFANKLLEK